jgi:glutathione S-transferase
VSYLPADVVSIKRLDRPDAGAGPDGRVISGSARIIDELSAPIPRGRCIRRTRAARAGAVRAAALRRRGRSRRPHGDLLGDDPERLPCATFARTQRLKQAIYRAAFADEAGGREGERRESENVERALARTERALTTARMIGPSGQLVGPAFSVADLTVAALLAPLVALPHPDMARTQPVPARVAELSARFEKHPAAQWVREQYAKHRPASHGVPAQAGRRSSVTP